MSRAPTVEEVLRAIDRTLTRIFFRHWSTAAPRSPDNDNG